MNILKNVSMTLSSPVLTGLNKTNDLVATLNIFGDGIQADTQILSVDSASQITLTKSATKTQIASVEFTTASRDVYLERLNALKDVKDVMLERGDLISFIFREESDISRDNTSSISKRNFHTELFFRAFPVDFQPNAKALQKAGLREECNVLIYTSMLDWINYGIDFNDIEMATRNTVRLQGNTYEVKEKGLYGQFNDTFLYVTFGLFKK